MILGSYFHSLNKNAQEKYPQRITKFPFFFLPDILYRHCRNRNTNSCFLFCSPPTLSFILGAKNRRRLRAKRRKASFPRSKPGTITITVSSTTFVETKLPGNLCDHSWSFFLAKGTQRSIMLYNADVLQKSALYYIRIKSI